MTKTKHWLEKHKNSKGGKYTNEQMGMFSNLNKFPPDFKSIVDFLQN